MQNENSSPERPPTGLPRRNRTRWRRPPRRSKPNRWPESPSCFPLLAALGHLLIVLVAGGSASASFAELEVTNNNNGSSPFTGGGGDELAPPLYLGQEGPLPDYVIDDFVDSEAGYLQDTPGALQEGVSRSLSRREAQAQQADESALGDLQSPDELPVASPLLAGPRPPFPFQDSGGADRYPLANPFYFDPPQPQLAMLHRGQQQQFQSQARFDPRQQEPIQQQQQDPQQAAELDEQVPQQQQQPSAAGQFPQKMGPAFTREPPAFIHYLNSSDLIIPCAASGQPAPSITWWQKSGQLRVGSLHDKRYVRYDNALVISAFRPHEFEPEVHAASYRCQAANSLGSVISRDVVINAVIDQEYEASVADQFVTVDNDALFRCQLAPQVRDIHQVLGWLEDGQQLVSAASATPMSLFGPAGGKSLEATPTSKRRTQQQQQRAMMLPDGQLYIQRVQLRDANKSYRCQIKNLLNGRLSTSSISGRLFVTDANESGASPRIVEGPRAISTGRLGEPLLLVCLAQGSPRPSVRWFRWSRSRLDSPSATTTTTNQLDERDDREAQWLEVAPLANSSASQNQTAGISGRQQVVGTSEGGNFLLIRFLQAQDQRAKFKCLTNNSFGAHQLETELRLDPPPGQAGKPIELRPRWEFIQESPQQVAVQSSKEPSSLQGPRPAALVLNCSVRATSQPLVALEWLKNGRHLFSVALASVQQQQQQPTGQQVANNSLAGWPSSIFDEPAQELLLTDFGLWPGSPATSAQQVLDPVQVDAAEPQQLLAQDQLGELASQLQQQQNVISTSSSSLQKLSQNQQEQEDSPPRRLWQALRMQNADLLVYQLAFGSLKRADRGSYQCRTKSLASFANSGQGMFATGNPSPLSLAGNPPGHHTRYAISHQTSQLLLRDTAPKFVETFASLLVNGAPGGQEQNANRNHHQLPQVSLKCVASGSPLPEISWSLSGFQVPESSRFHVGDYVTRDGLIVSFVNISNVQPEDGGLYECAASNDVGQLRHAAWLNVTGPAHIRAMPKVSAIAGGSLVVMCPVGGWPVEQISWFQNSSKLPANHRQKVFPNGTLVISDLNEVLDSGQYSCQAKSLGSDQFALQHAQVSIKVPPVVEPFTFAKSLHRGQRYNIMCTVTRGDLPVSIRWFKDGQPIELATSFSIANANGEFAGQQTGGGGLLETQADRGPFAPGGQSHQDVLAGLAIKQLDPYSSTLTFASLQSHHRGEYSCEATNEVGRANQSSSLVIHVPPEWRIEPNDQSVTIGRTAVIDCQAEGFPAARIEWRLSQDLYREPPSEFKPIISSLYMRVFENGSLIIYNTQRTDAGYYLCQANNGVGPGISRVIKLTVHVAAHFKTKIRNELVRRGQPARLKCEAIGDPPIEISWLKDKLPLYGALGEEPRYALAKNVLQDGMLSELTIQETDRTDSALFTCLTQNQFGSDDTNIQLIVQGPPEPPEELRAHELEARSVRLAWLPGHSGNSPLLRHVLMCAQAAQSVAQQLPVQQQTGSQATQQQQLQWFNTSVQGNESSCLLQGLVPLTEYQCHLVAVNALGSSRLPAEPMVRFSTLDETPSLPPLFVKAQALSSHSIRVRWRTPERASRQQQQGQQQQQHFGLTTAYYVGYKLYRPDEAGGSSSSSSSSSSSQAVEPASNQQEQFMYKTLDFATASANALAASATPGQEANNSNRSSAGLEQECLLTGLRRGQKYLITVQPFNGRGSGPVSEPVLAETWRVDVPEPPSLRMLSRTTRSIHLAWRLAGSGGSAPSAGPAKYAPGKSLVAAHHLGGHKEARGEHHHAHQHAAAANEIGLTPEELAAEQAQASEPILGFILTRKQVLGPGSEFSAAAMALQSSSSSSSSLLLSNNNQVPPQPPEQVVETRLPSDHMSQIVENLTCGTRYQFTISAINSVGVSAPSEPLVAKTEGSKPVAPDRNSLLSLNASSVVINLAAWHNGACLMRSFDILFKPSRAKKWTTLTNYQIAPRPPSAGGGSTGKRAEDEPAMPGEQSMSRSLVATRDAADQNGTSATNQQRQGALQQQQPPPHENGTIVLDDLANSVNYDLKILATNEAGTTEAFYTFNTNGNSISSLDQQWSATGGEFRLGDAAQLGELFSGPLAILPILLLLLISVTFSYCLLVARRRHNSPSNCSLSISSRSNQSSSNYCTTTTTTTTNAASSLAEHNHLPGDLKSATTSLLANPNGRHVLDESAQLNHLMPSPQQQQQQMRLSDIYATQHRPQAILSRADPKSHYAYLTTGRVNGHTLHHNGQQAAPRSLSPVNTEITSVINDAGDEAEMCLGASALNLSGGGAGEQQPSSLPHHSATLHKPRPDYGGGPLEQHQAGYKSSTLPSNCHQQMLIQKLIAQQQQQADSAASQQQQQALISSFMAANLIQQQQQQHEGQDGGQETSQDGNAAAAAAYALQVAAIQAANRSQQQLGNPQSMTIEDSFNLANLNLIEQQQQQQHHPGGPQVYATVKRGCPRPSAQQQRQALCDYTTIYQCPVAQQQQHQADMMGPNSNNNNNAQCSCASGPSSLQMQQPTQMMNQEDQTQANGPQFCFQQHHSDYQALRQLNG